MKVCIDVGWVEVDIQFDSFGLTNDDVTRVDSELFFVYLILFISNEPI